MNLEIDLRWIRKQKGQVAKDVAEELDISVATLYAWETGRSKPNKPNRETILRWILGKTEQEISEEKAIKKWLQNKDPVEEVAEVDPDDWDKGKGSLAPNQFLVSLERPPGVSKVEMADYIDQAIRVECGHYLPGDPIFHFCHLRDTVKVMPRR